MTIPRKFSHLTPVVWQKGKLQNTPSKQNYGQSVIWTCDLLLKYIPQECRIWPSSWMTLVIMFMQDLRSAMYRITHPFSRSIHIGMRRVRTLAPQVSEIQWLVWVVALSTHICTGRCCPRVLEQGDTTMLHLKKFIPVYYMLIIPTDVILAQCEFEMNMNISSGVVLILSQLLIFIAPDAVM